MRDFSFGVEVCEDLWVAASPSVEHAKHGATIICNPSTSDDVIGKAQYRRDLVKMQSGKLCCAIFTAIRALAKAQRIWYFRDRT